MVICHKNIRSFYNEELSAVCYVPYGCVGPLMGSVCCIGHADLRTRKGLCGRDEEVHGLRFGGVLQDSVWIDRAPDECRFCE